jgi:hypothetical protein
MSISFVQVRRIKFVIFFACVHLCAVGLVKGTEAGSVPVRIYAAVSGRVIIRFGYNQAHDIVCSLLDYNSGSGGYDYRFGFSIATIHMPTDCLVNDHAKRLFVAWGAVRDFSAPILSIYSFDGHLIKQLHMNDVFTAKQMVMFEPNLKGADYTWYRSMHIDRRGVAVIETTARELETGFPHLVLIDDMGAIRVDMP